MRLLLVCLLAFAGIMMAMDPDGGPRASYETPPPGRADITMTVINDYGLTGISSPRGLDYVDTSGELIMSDYGSDMLYSLDPDDGTVGGSMACPPELPNILGVAVIEVSPSVWELYANDWQDVMDVWLLQMGTWSYAFPNPVNTEPRGMDSDDEDMLWSIDASTRYLVQFDTSGGNITSWDSPNCPPLTPAGYPHSHMMEPRHSGWRLFIRELLLLRVRRSINELHWSRRGAPDIHRFLRDSLQLRPGQLLLALQDRILRLPDNRVRA